MGEKPTILLVKGTYLTLLLIGIFFFQKFGPTQIVQPNNYEEFWVWAGVKSRPVISKAKVIYLHQGEIFENSYGESQLISQGGTQPGPHKQNLWIVYRVRTLNWNDKIFQLLRNRFEFWSSFPGKIVGIQIDFDASTKNLQKYASFLNLLRSKMPENCLISVTGLMDWASQAAPEDLNSLSISVDELVFQTYRGQSTVSNIESYLERLNRVHIPFRLGLAEGAKWRPSIELSRNKYFKGYIVFLKN